MEVCPKNTNLTGVYKTACNRCARVDQSALAVGLGVGRSTLHGVITAINYAMQCICISRY